MAELGWSEGGGAVTTPGGARPSLDDVGAEFLFEKVLTPCDAASRGRIVLPKKAAVEHFACQDGKVGLTVCCEDTFGNEHTILHRFWTNAKSRMYLLEGLESVLRVYKVSPGDVLLFGRMPSGKMVVSARVPGPGDMQRSRRAANPTGSANDKPAKVKQLSMPAVATRRQKRARLLERAASVDSESSQEGADYFQPPPDGVFRAVPPSTSHVQEPQVLDHGNCWSATADIGGELYQAFFDTAAGAFDAFITAGHDLPDDLAAAAIAFEAEQQAAAAEAYADAEPDELEAGGAAPDVEAADHEDGDGAACGLGAEEADMRLGASANNSPAAQHPADDAVAQAADEPQEQVAEAGAAISAAAAGGSGATAGETTADGVALAAAGTEPCSPAAAEPGVELTLQPAAAVAAPDSLAATAAVAQAEDRRAADMAPDLPLTSAHAQLANAAQDAPAAAGDRAADPLGWPVAVGDVAASDTGIKADPDLAARSTATTALPDTDA